MKTIINTPNAPAPIGPYNQAVLVNNTLYTSGQIALDPNTMELVMDNIEAMEDDEMDVELTTENLASVAGGATKQ